MEAVAETGNATPCALLAMGTHPQSGESLYKWLQTRASDAGILHQSQIFALRAGHSDTVVVDISHAATGTQSPGKMHCKALYG